MGAAYKISWRSVQRLQRYARGQTDTHRQTEGLVTIHVTHILERSNNSDHYTRQWLVVKRDKKTCIRSTQLFTIKQQNVQLSVQALLLWELTKTKTGPCQLTSSTLLDCSLNYFCSVFLKVESFKLNIKYHTKTLTVWTHDTRHQDCLNYPVHQRGICRHGNRSRTVSRCQHDQSALDGMTVDWRHSRHETRRWLLHALHSQSDSQESLQFYQSTQTAHNVLYMYTCVYIHCEKKKTYQSFFVISSTKPGRLL